jgi:hypothetical protein
LVQAGVHNSSLGATRLAVIALLAFAALVAACTPAVETPRSMERTLATLTANGLVCGDPQVDNVPSGLLQWRCPGQFAGQDVLVLVDGDAKGVFEINATIESALDHPAQAETFIKLLRATDIAGNHQDEFIGWLQAWKGEDTNITFGRASGRLFASDLHPSLRIAPGPRRSVDDPV